MSDTAVDELALPQEFVDAVARRAADRGIDGEVAAAFVRAVLRRLPTDLAEGADPRTALTGVVQLLTQVASSPGPMVDISHRPPSLDPQGRAVGVLQIHGLDRPFLLSTVLATLRAMDIGTLRALHPIIGVERDEDGRLVRVLPARTAERRESIIHVELDRALTDRQVEELERELETALADVTAATDDFHPMRERMAELADRIRGGRSHHDSSRSCATRSPAC
jgi:glutamate dehydrogenase